MLQSRPGRLHSLLHFISEEITAQENFVLQLLPENLCHIKMSGDERTFIHLLGKTGTGRSSTGNTILGRKAFNAKSSLSAVTKVIQVEESSDLMGNQGTAIVVDGPGLVGVNTGVNEEAIRALEKVVNENQECRHVFLIICRYGERFTEEDEEMLRSLKKVFRQKVLETHGIVILTCGDNFERDVEDDDLTFEQWCDMQTGAFSDLCGWCKNRIILVDNSKKSESKGKVFLGNLQKKMKEIPCGYKIKEQVLVAETASEGGKWFSWFWAAANYLMSFYSETERLSN